MKLTVRKDHIGSVRPATIPEQGILNRRAEQNGRTEQNIKIDG